MNQPAPEVWQHLVQWQPATAAALAQHIRALPDDWPLRVFGVGRPDAALTLSPGAIGEQFPDRTPEIAPYDEIAPLDDCPACTEVEGTCRFHEGYAAGHHEQVQAQLDAVRVNPAMGLREFMRWQADVEEAEDRGEEPPVMPAAASASLPPTDRAALERVRAVLETEAVVGRSALEYRGLIASALMATEEQQPSRCPHGCDVSRCPCLACEADDDVAQQPTDESPTDRATVLQQAADELDRYVGLQSSEAAPEVYGARFVIRELRRIANEPAQDEAKRCAQCSHPKRDHDGRADHRERHSPVVAGDPWCHACNAACDYAPPSA
jgi:hypothetical protein